ncbi:hypothetical protein DEU56DRAFT_862026 [Suillus clintonianus]|uniref:uncharacterized protein n=1 Tax=Suillus clintonianus TaxID=1904413 RepID=UPI001B86FECA|nr:uncharacterized protein DEU56DRAFT_862026 [Suillus clintonianus]KAG2126939.1 hypothetical protein DEU56DRAFT_862026 [Suillus clintonianus]
MLSKKPKKDSKQPAPETEESQDDNVSQLLGVIIAAITVTKDLVPINLAKGILGTIANILTIAQSVIKNKSDFRAIANKCDTIRKVLERVTKDLDAAAVNLPASLRDALSELNISVKRIHNEITSKMERRFWKRLLSVTIDRDQIAGWEKDLDRVLALFNFEAIADIAMDVKFVKKLALEFKSNIPSVNVLKYHPTEPPPRPSMFYGRDNLVAELTNLVVNNEYIALIGPGGMGKSSLAKAILNEPLIKDKFADRRFFVTYDGLDPSTITFEAFVTRFAGALGIELAGADPMRHISAFLRSARTLVVLDNAETFEEASGSLALRDIPPAIAEIADIPGVILIVTSRSRRNAPNVPWIAKDIPPLDLTSALTAFFQIYNNDNCSNAEEDIKDLLKELDFHPLSINLLAKAAQQNSWSPATLLKRWNNRHSKVLDPGEGKLQSLSDTMQLSLTSPSIQNLGDGGRRALAIIAFFPQGLNDTLASNLLPSLPQVDMICDVLCRQSLVYRQDSFIKLLAPIRHYVRDSLLPPDSTCLAEIRAFYYRTVRLCSEERDVHAHIIISDHLNIEHVVVSDLAHVPDSTGETYDICCQFLRDLRWHLPRPTTLAPAIFNIIPNSSTLTPKANCLRQLGWLYRMLSQLTEQITAFQAAKALYLTAGDYEDVAICVTTLADIYRCQGLFIQSQRVLEDLQRSRSWKYLSGTTKAQVWYFLDSAKMYTFTASADELFVKSMGDSAWGLISKVRHWGAQMYYGGDIVQVKMHLEDLLEKCTRTGNLHDRKDALWVLADVAFCAGRLSEAMDILQNIVEMFEGQDCENLLWYAVWKAAVAGHQGDFALARELIQKAFNKASRSLEFLALRSARTFLHTSYVSASIELTASEYDRAESHFTATIESCDIQGELLVKAFSTRGLGEVAFARGDFPLATHRFAETRSLCTEMGVPPRNLYSCVPLDVLPDRFEGWALFLDGRSPCVM